MKADERIKKIIAKCGFEDPVEFYQHFYHNIGLSTHKISKEFGGTADFHLYYMRKLGMKLRPAKNTLSVSTDEIVNLIDKGFSHSQVASKLGIKCTTVGNRVYRNKHKKKIKGESKKGKPKKKCAVCQSLFSGPNYRVCPSCVTKLGTQEFETIGVRL